MFGNPRAHLASEPILHVLRVLPPVMDLLWVLFRVHRQFCPTSCYSNGFSYETGPETAHPACFSLLVSFTPARGRPALRRNLGGIDFLFLLPAGARTEHKQCRLDGSPCWRLLPSCCDEQQALLWSWYLTCSVLQGFRAS